MNNAMNNALHNRAAGERLAESVASRWVRLGVLFNVEAATPRVDLERLLLDTARAAQWNTRLLILAVTWLARHGDTVGKHRLTQLIRDELEIDHRATMGLILDLARSAATVNRTRFDRAVAECEAAGTGAAGALSEVERRSVALSRLAEQRASVLSRKWGRWVEDFELKLDALRPAQWVMRHNPELYERALTNGDLVASVIAECDASGGTIGSEADLARRLGASRPAVRSAIETLERTGRVHVERRGRAHAVRLEPLLAA